MLRSELEGRRSRGRKRSVMNVVKKDIKSIVIREGKANGRPN